MKSYRHNPALQHIYQISLNYCTVHQLLQLQVSQIVTHHHLQHRKQLTVSYETILIDVIDLKSKSKLVFFVSAVKGSQSCMDEVVPDRNSLKDIFPSLFLSKMEMTLLTSGF